MEILSTLLTPAVAIIISMLLVLVSISLLQLRTSRSQQLPPGPMKLPLIGNLHQLGQDPLLHLSLQRLSNKHGPLMHLQLGSISTLIVSSAEFTKEIFKFHDLAFSSRPPMYAAKKLGYDHSDIAFAPYGDYWREIRKIAVLELLSTRRVQTFQSIRNEEITLLLDAVARASLGGESFDLSQEMLTLSNNLICRVALGKKWDDGGDDGDTIDKVLNETQALLGEVNLADFYPWLGWVVNKFNGFDKRLNDNFQRIDKFFDEIIAEHRSRRVKIEGSRHDHDDIIDVLLRIQSDPNQAISLTDNQIKGVLMDLFVAGTDTTAATVVWTMAELISNPSILKKVQEELRQFNEEKNHQWPQISESELPNNLSYLKMVIKESLRLHPPVPLLVPRETTQPCEVGGYHLPAKTRVFVNAWAISKDPDYWVDPNRFDPGRFSNELMDFEGQDFGFIPFGVGRRICPGMNFAMVMVELALANLLCAFDWELPSRPGVLDMEEAVGLASHKKTPLLLTARGRYNA